MTIHWHHDGDLVTAKPHADFQLTVFPTGTRWSWEIVPAHPSGLSDPEDPQPTLPSGTAGSEAEATKAAEVAWTTFKAGGFHESDNRNKPDTLRAYRAEI